MPIPFQGRNLIFQLVRRHRNSQCYLKPPKKWTNNAVAKKCFREMSWPKSPPCGLRASFQMQRKLGPLATMMSSSIQKIGFSAPDEIVAKSHEVDAILPCHSEHFNADVVARMSDRVKIIANHSVGVDHCDFTGLEGQRCRRHQHTPDVLSDATAEIALLLMLAAARRAGEGDRLVRAGNWDSWSPAFMVGTQMTGKRLGIVGMGRVGRAFAKLVQGFGMEIHYYNRRQLPPEQEAGAIYHAAIEDLLPHCQFVSLHCPATPETLNLMNAERFALLPEGAILVNTARGTLIDEAALDRRTKLGSSLPAAGLDVFQTGAWRQSAASPSSTTFACYRISVVPRAKLEMRWVFERSITSTHSLRAERSLAISSSRGSAGGWDFHGVLQAIRADENGKHFHWPLGPMFSPLCGWR